MDLRWFRGRSRRGPGVLVLCGAVSGSPAGDGVGGGAVRAEVGGAACADHAD